MLLQQQEYCSTLKYLLFSHVCLRRSFFFLSSIFLIVTYLYKLFSYIQSSTDSCALYIILHENYSISSFPLQIQPCTENLPPSEPATCSFACILWHLQLLFTHSVTSSHLYYTACKFLREISIIGAECVRAPLLI